jgi:UDP-glucuronate 4-epimerase
MHLNLLLASKGVDVSVRNASTTRPRNLSPRHPWQVVGIDSYQGFYSVEMKKARAAKIARETGHRVQNISVCEEARITQILRDQVTPLTLPCRRGANSATLTHARKSQGITHVVHLAAQPGVRFSIDFPHHYVNQNVDCFISVLQAIRAQPKESYVRHRERASALARRV